MTETEERSSIAIFSQVVYLPRVRNKNSVEAVMGFNIHESNGPCTVMIFAGRNMLVENGDLIEEMQRPGY